MAATQEIVSREHEEAILERVVDSLYERRLTQGFSSLSPCSKSMLAFVIAGQVFASVLATSALESSSLSQNSSDLISACAVAMNDFGVASGASGAGVASV